jgi:hypothetical protein
LTTENIPKSTLNFKPNRPQTPEPGEIAQRLDQCEPLKFNQLRYFVEELIESEFDPRLGAREFRLKRHVARDLKRILFGSKGLNDDTPRGAGGIIRDLPRGWTVEFEYHEPMPNWDTGVFWQDGEVASWVTVWFEPGQRVPA